MTHPQLLSLWQAKLAAWLHDPPEKALTLTRTPEGHEHGTAARLREFCFGSEQAPRELAQLAKLADRWAAASDRPQWPVAKEDKGFDKKILFWSRSGATLIHPLGGDVYHLGDLYVAASGRLVTGASEKMREILRTATEDVGFAAGAEDPEGKAAPLGVPEEALAAADIPAELGKEEAPTLQALRRAVLALWRLGPVTDPKEFGLGEVWRLLPADSRVPDHSIWEHNALASAMAGALAVGERKNPALLLVSLGPVQGFIEQARTTSDLWAGSHLLSYLAWEAMKPVAEVYGPDAILFPSLWGVPLVDVWLEDQGLKLPDAKEDRRSPDWKHAPTDSNPLFSPCLPNRFVALVPASAAEELAGKIRDEVRKWAKEQAHKTAAELCRLAGVEQTEDMRRQVEEQLADFPEVYWAVVPFKPLVALDIDGSQSADASSGAQTSTATELDVQQLQDALRLFCGEAEPGFFKTNFWKALQGLPHGGRGAASAEAGAEYFRYSVNPGTVYPALVQLAERVLAASKATRTFLQTRQEGYRCSVCGEREWLRGPGDDQPTEQEASKKKPRKRFELPAGQRGETLWTKLQEKNRSLAKKNEHLCALCATKRLWPRLFAKTASKWVKWPKEQKGKEGEGKANETISRFVVSTHTMALAPDLAQLPLRPRPGESADKFQERQGAYKSLVEFAERASNDSWTVLPKKLAENIQRQPEDVKNVCRVIPELFDQLKDEDEGERNAGPEPAARITREKLEGLWKKAFGHRPETYYGLIQMDGDQAGKWLSGDPDLMLRLRELWHPDLAGWISSRHTAGDDPIRKLLEAPRPASPGYQAALSGAMSAFALETARWVVEELFLGRLIYSGGDDALAMVAVDDLIPCMFALRCAFSGIVPAGEKDSVWELYRQLGAKLGDIDRGYVRVRHRLLRAMGGRMTASMGAVIAHHEAPLQAVLRRLREAEKAAKGNGRNSFSIVVSKRGGGETAYTASWGFGGVQRDGLPPEKHRDVPYIPGEWAKVLTKDLVTPIGVLLRLRDTLALPFVSRRAVYHTVEWLEGVPAHPGCPKAEMKEDDYRRMLADTLAWQLHRQGVRPELYEKHGYEWLLRGDKAPAKALAEDIVTVALRQCKPWAGRSHWLCVPDHLKAMLTVAEFLAREGRAPLPPSAEGKGGEA